MKKLSNFLLDADKIINNEKIDEFNRLYDFLCENNKICNLTSITEKNEVFYKHFYDSISSKDFYFEGAKVIEIGSGAGFPSIPLKLVRQDICLTLVEATGKKCGYLNKIVDNFRLNCVQVINERAEILSKQVIHRENYDYCVARAVARLNSLVEYCLPFVKVGGQFIAYKGKAEEEIKEAENAIKILGGEIEDAYSYSLPQDLGERQLVVINKIKNTPEKYPRGQGKERSKPL